MLTNNWGTAFYASELQSLPVTMKCPTGHCMLLWENTLNRPEKLVKQAHYKAGIGLKNNNNKKNQESFISWLLKGGSGINLQNTIRILVMFKASQASSQYHPDHPPHSSMRFIWNEIQDPWRAPITKMLLLLLYFMKLSSKKTTLPSLTIRRT